MASTTALFNPYTQNITILAPDLTPTNVSIPDIDSYIAYGIRISINYASQIGASLILLVVLLLLTTPEKRTSTIFFLNAFSCALNTVRNVLEGLYFTGPFYEFYTYFSGDYSTVPREAGEISIAGDVLTLLLLACVEGSLVLQVRAVCVTLRDRSRLLLMLLSTGVALTAIGVRFGLTVTNSEAIVATQDFSSFAWLAATNNYVTTASICFFSAVFVGKLGVTINQRRKMHVKQFGPMQVIFIMGCQTLIVPGKSITHPTSRRAGSLRLTLETAIFSILQNFTSVPELGSQVLTLTSLFLPLSSMWASASLTKKPKPSALNDHNAKPASVPFRSNSPPRLDLKSDNEDDKRQSHSVLARFLSPTNRNNQDSAGSSGQKLVAGLSTSTTDGSQARTSKTYSVGGSDVEKKSPLSPWSAGRSREGGVLGGFDFEKERRLRGSAISDSETLRDERAIEKESGKAEVKDLETGDGEGGGRMG